MTLDWPLVVLCVAALASLVVAMRIMLPYVLGQSTERSRQKALDDISERLNKVEAHLMTSVRKLPGRLG